MQKSRNFDTDVTICLDKSGLHLFGLVMPFKAMFQCSRQELHRVCSSNTFRIPR
jgi:hypothetical protein